MSSPTALGTCYFKPVPHQPWAPPGNRKAPRPVEGPDTSSGLYHPVQWWKHSGWNTGLVGRRAGGGQGGLPGAVGSLGGQVRIRVDVKRISGKGNQRSQKAQRSEEAWLGGVLSGKEVQSAKTSRGHSVGCDWGRRKCWGPVGGLEVTR